MTALRGQWLVRLFLRIAYGEEIMPTRLTLQPQQRRELAFLLFGATLFALAAWVFLAPNESRAKSADYKFMHCTTCGFERPYDQKMSEGKCPKCHPPKVGY